MYQYSCTCTVTGVGHDTIIMSFNHTGTSSSSSSTRPQHESSSTSAAISSGAPTTATTGGGAAGPSQAKRRLEAMTASIDHKLAAVFTVILVFYSMVTFGTWVRIESQEITTPVMSALTTRHSVATTRTTTTTTTTTTSAKNNNNNNNSGQQLAVGAGGIIVPKMVRLEDIHDIETLQHTFPVHVGDDMEEIDHPGIFMADKEKMAAMFENHPELPRNGKMRVPKFWKPVAYGEKGVRGFLGEDGKRLITPEEAKAIGSFDPATGRETIYVSVASYRDWECQPTVEDMFLRAEHPERLRVAIIDQRAENDSVQPCAVPEKPCSEDPSQTLCRFHHLIDRYEVPAHLSVGPVFARHLANRMYRGEYFAMQVDSHVRFIRNWDSDIISQWESAKNEMGVLSVYLSDIIGSIDPVTFENHHPARPIMCKTDYEGNGKMRHLRHGQQPEGVPGIHGEPTLHPFWAAGFSFARGHFTVQVPYDQYQPMVFQGEEIFMGLRGFTYGYDYYAPETSVAFHMYAIKENKEKRKKIKLFWENEKMYPGSAVEGMKRLNGIIGMGDPDDVDKYYKGDEHFYGLGNARPKEKFFQLYGIHTDTKMVEDHLCTYVGKPMMQKFKPYLRADRMGIDFTDLDFEWKDPKPKETKSTRKQRKAVGVVQQ